MTEEASVSESVVDSTQEASQEPVSEEVVSEQSGEGELAGEESVIEEVAPQLYELKIDGEVVQVTLDEMTALAQKGKASTKKFQEAAQLQKQIAAEKAAIQAALQGKPEDLFALKMKAGNMSKDQYREWVIQQALQIAEEEEMSPEEREREEMRRRLEEYERKEKEAEEAKKNQAFEAEKEKYREEFSSQIMDAINNGGLEPDPLTIRKVASVLESSIGVDGQMSISVADAVEYVKEQDGSALINYINSLDEDKLMKVLGNDRLGKLRAKDISKLQNPEAPIQSEDSTSQPSSPKKKKEKISAKDFWASRGVF